MSAVGHSVAERMRKRASWMLASVCIAAIAVSRSYWPLHDVVHEAIEEAGALFIGACIFGRLFCTLYIGGRKNAKLVTDGPYSVVRNPLYLFSVVGAGGLGLSSGSLSLGLIFAGGYFALLDAAVRGEERRLLKAFGPRYFAYLNDVRRWLPDFSRWRDAAFLSVNLRLAGRRLNEAGGLLIAVPMIEALEQLHEAGMLPVFLILP